MTTPIDESEARLAARGWAALLSAWTPWQDDLARSDRAVGSRMRFLFTPLGAPTLSAAGARAGLGPDGAAREGRGTADVDTRPDPRLDRPIASRLADDISEAAQMAQAERMGVHVPVEAPTLSPRGAMAGLGAFGPSSSSPRAVALASARELGMSRSKVAMAGRKTTAMVSRPVPAISDASGRVGISGRGQIRAAGRGFEMRVPKGPVAEDRERWKSGTQDRIAASSKGLSLANMDWGDHRAASPKPAPKRTWVGKQGDATECSENYKETCADLAMAPHGSVNKSAPLRELEKETVPSDVCPPIKSTTATLGAVLGLDARLLGMAPEGFHMPWASRPLLQGRSALRGGAETFKLPKSAMKGITSPTGPDCGCSDCGCNGNGKSKNGNGRASGQELAALAESVAKRRAPPTISEPEPDPKLLANIINVARTLRGANDKKFCSSPLPRTPSSRRTRTCSRRTS